MNKINRLFYQAKLKKQVDPDVFVTYLECLRTTMGDMDNFITDKQFIMHVMNNLNKDYDNTVENLEKLIDGKNDPLTIEQMREDLSLKHERLYGTEDTGEFESDDDGEHALYSGPGRWKRKCNKCGKRKATKPLTAAQMEMELTNLKLETKAVAAERSLTENAPTAKGPVTVRVTVSRKKGTKAVSRQTPQKTATKTKSLMWC